MMKAWYEKSINALQLNGKGERTQEAYTRAVRMLVEFYHKTPDQITEDDLQRYFLHRRNADRWSPATLRICYSGLRFFSCPASRLAHAQAYPCSTRTTVAHVLSREEAQRLLGCVRTPHNCAFATVYARSLRLQEAQYLEVGEY